MMHRWAGIGIAALLASLFAVVWLSSAVPGSRPMTWQVVGQIGGPTQDVAVQGDYAYVGVGLRLVVLDVTNPVMPTEVGSTTPFPYFVEDIVVSGTRAYVAAGGAGLRVVDVSDPPNALAEGDETNNGAGDGTRTRDRMLGKQAVGGKRLGTDVPGLVLCQAVTGPHVTPSGPTARAADA